MAKDGLLKEDQYVFLEKKSKTGETEYYTVRPGETLYSIAQKNGITLQSLFNYNTIGIGDKLEPGTKLLLKPGSAVAAGK